ncbi:MAG: hypothetical protein WCG27_01450 [Pseudomonadota bacterium]
MAQKIALGKGMASLIQQTHTEDIVAQTIHDTKDKGISDSSSIFVDISQIKVNPNQPRKIFKEKQCHMDLDI